MVTEALSTDGHMTLITSGETFIPLAGESGYSLLMLKMDPDASEADVQAAFNAGGGGATLRYKPRLCASRKICLKQGKRPRNRHKYGKLKKHILSPILERFGVPDGLHEYYIAYYIEGISAIIRGWINRNCAEEIDTIAGIIQRCVRAEDDAHEMEACTEERREPV